MKKFLIPLAFVVNISLTVFGFGVLLESPYTGLRMSVCGDHACVKSVDKNSPAYGKIQPGDRVYDVSGLNISYLIFHEDPDYIRLERDFDKFWEAEYALHDAVVRGRPLEISVEKVDSVSTVSLIPVEFPFSQAFLRTAPIYMVGWTFLIVAYLVYRKKANEASRIFLLVGAFVCIDWAAGAPFTVRDVSFPYIPFRILNRIDFLSALILICSFLHMALVFPKRLLRSNLHSWTVGGLYSLAVLLIILRLMHFFDNTYLTTYTAFSVVLTAVVIVYTVQYFAEKNPIVRRQIKWVVLSILISSIIYGGLSSIPVLLGSEFVSVALSGLGFILIPLSFAFAITRYRLMEIENILDAAVIYGFTVLVLAGVEAVFLSFASPYVLAGGKGLPYFSVIAVLLIVFIYVPVRNFIKGLVERLFKRGRYDVEKELQQFTMSLGQCDESEPLEKFTLFVKGLLRPSGVIVMKIAGGTVSLLHADNEHVRSQGNAVLAKAEAVWERVRNRGTCVGYEISETFAVDGSLFAPDLENALFVPFFSNSADVRSGYLAVLLKKWNETAYSVKDVTLLNAISVNIAGIIEAGELRRERAEIEEKFRKEKDYVMREKDYVMRELHDGLGNILTSVTVTSQAAERMLKRDTSNAKELVARISEYSSDAMDFMRTGLTILDNPGGDVATIMETVKDRFDAAFESSGTELRIDCSEDAGRQRPGAVLALNLARIIQEAFGNIMKHAGAKHACVRVDWSGGRLSMTISDDGKGFLVEEKKTGFGLKNLLKRIEDMRGSMDVSSSPGKGTELRFTMPLAANGEEAVETHAPGNR